MHDVERYGGSYENRSEKENTGSSNITCFTIGHGVNFYYTDTGKKFSR